MYAALREQDPVHHVADGDYWVLSRYADVFDAARDPSSFSSRGGLTPVYGDLDAIGLGDDPPLVFLDPPEHTEFRRMVGPAFTPRQVAAIEPDVRSFVVERIEQLRTAGEGDIVEALFKPLPSLVVAHYLGVPDVDRAQFDSWSAAIVAATTAGDPLQATDAVTELMVYFTELIAWRRSHPGDDTVSHLLAAGLGADGDDRGLLRILGFAFTMVAGGNDTTTGLLGGAVQLLTERRDQRKVLTADPSLLEGAVEELLRLTSPVQGLARTATTDIDIAGSTIPSGRKVLLLYASANRDDRQFGPDAESLDVRRNPRQILTFSYGNHHCLGAAAARMQGRVALEELLSRCPDFEVDVDGMQWADGSFVRRPTRVPIRMSP